MLRNTIKLPTLLTLCVMSGCHDVKTTWSARVLSPDRMWLASAASEQHGGPGTAGSITTVRLTREVNPQSPIDILVFEQTGPSSIKLKMQWKDPTHLMVAYQNADLDFQAVKCGGVSISALAVSG